MDQVFARVGQYLFVSEHTGYVRIEGSFRRGVPVGQNTAREQPS